MKPEVGKQYRIRIPRQPGYEYLGEQTTVAVCLFRIMPGRWDFGIPLPHEGDEGRGVGFGVNEIDILEEAS